MAETTSQDTSGTTEKEKGEKERKGMDAEQRRQMQSRETNVGQTQPAAQAGKGNPPSSQTYGSTSWGGKPAYPSYPPKEGAGNPPTPAATPGAKPNPANPPNPSPPSPPKPTYPSGSGGTSTATASTTVNPPAAGGQAPEAKPEEKKPGTSEEEE
jgi:hypothetical protein